MRIELVVEGGIAHLPGLARPFVIDSASLAAEEARRLSLLVEASGVLRRPGPRPPEEPAHAGRRRAPATPGRGADLRSYRITVEDGARRRTLTLRDPLGPRLAPLVEYLRAKQREERQRPSGDGGGGHGEE